MGTDSKIEWTHHTFNPVLGCAKVHAGCTNCYAETDMAVVMRKGGRIHWGEVWQGGDRVVVADSTWAKPLTWARAAAKAGERRRVFCASLADVLEVPEMPPEVLRRTAGEHAYRGACRRVEQVRAEMDRARARLWDTIRQTAFMGDVGPDEDPREVGYPPHAPDPWGRPGLDWLLLTKRPENWALVPKDVRPLVWLGTSISDQETADEWVPRLLAAEGFRYRFLSVEPMVGPADLSAFFGGPYVGLPGDVVHERYNHGINWVIVGGESGRKARPCNVEWIHSIVRQCAESGTACFVKQLGALPRICDPSVVPFDGRQHETVLSLQDPKGGDWSEWPDDLRVRQFPGDR